MRLLFWLLAIPCLALAGAFAAVNAGPVTLRIWPLPYEIVVPVYAAVLGAFFVGLFISALYFWIAGVPGRIALRRGRKHERALEEETVRLQRKLDEMERGETPPANRPGRIRRLLASGNE